MLTYNVSSEYNPQSDERGEQEDPIYRLKPASTQARFVHIPGNCNQLPRKWILHARLPMDVQKDRASVA